MRAARWALRKRPAPRNSLRAHPSPVHGASPGAAGILARSFYGRVRRQPREVQGVSTPFPEPASANIPQSQLAALTESTAYPSNTPFSAVSWVMLQADKADQARWRAIFAQNRSKPLTSAHIRPQQAHQSPVHHAIPRSRHTGPGNSVPAKKRRIAHKKILKTNPIGSLLSTSPPKNKPNQTQFSPG